MHHAIQALEGGMTDRERKKKKKEKKGFSVVVSPKQKTAKSWQVANQRKHEQSVSEGYEPGPLPNVDPHPIDVPSWFICANSFLKEQLSLACTFEYFPWDWQIDPATGKDTLRRYLSITIPRRKKHKRNTVPKLSFSTNFLTNKYISEVTTVFTETKKGEANATIVLLEFLGNQEKIDQKTYLVLEVTPQEVKTMYHFTSTREEGIRTPRELELYSQRPNFLKKNITLTMKHPIFERERVKQTPTVRCSKMA